MSNTSEQSLGRRQDDVGALVPVPLQPSDGSIESAQYHCREIPLKPFGAFRVNLDQSVAHGRHFVKIFDTTAHQIRGVTGHVERRRGEAQCIEVENGEFPVGVTKQLTDVEVTVAHHLRFVRRHMFAEFGYHFGDTFDEVRSTEANQIDRAIQHRQQRRRIACGNRGSRIERGRIEIVKTAKHRDGVVDAGERVVVRERVANQQFLGHETFLDVAMQQSRGRNVVGNHFECTCGGLRLSRISVDLYEGLRETQCRSLARYPRHASVRTGGVHTEQVGDFHIGASQHRKAEINGIPGEVRVAIGKFGHRNTTHTSFFRYGVACDQRFSRGLPETNLRTQIISVRTNLGSILHPQRFVRNVIEIADLQLAHLSGSAEAGLYVRPHQRNVEKQRSARQLIVVGQLRGDSR
jgi:hypothetical protein